MKNKEKLFDFLQKNYGWMVATITGLTVATSFILRFIKYMYSISILIIMVFHMDYLMEMN